MHYDVYYCKFTCSLHWYLLWIYLEKMFQALTITTLMINYVMMNISFLDQFNVTINSICFLMFLYICLFNMICLFFHILWSSSLFSWKNIPMKYTKFVSIPIIVFLLECKFTIRKGVLKANAHQGKNTFVTTLHVKINGNWYWQSSKIFMITCKKLSTMKIFGWWMFKTWMQWIFLIF